jgi:hypothetical protein
LRSSDLKRSETGSPALLARRKKVDNPHHQVIDPAAVVTRNHTVDDAKRRSYRADERHSQRNRVPKSWLMTSRPSASAPNRKAELRRQEDTGAGCCNVATTAAEPATTPVLVIDAFDQPNRTQRSADSAVSTNPTTKMRLMTAGRLRAS